MGSFSELVVSFSFRRDVGNDVLAAFSSLAIASEDPNAPAPPAPVEADDDWDWELDDPECDMSDPWAHDWGAWLGSSGTTAYIPSYQTGSLQWVHRRWVVTARATWKAAPADFIPNLAVLGSVIDAAAPEYADWQVPQPTPSPGFLVGYARFEYEPRPWLLWADGTVLRGEDLNPPGFTLP